MTNIRLGVSATVFNLALALSACGIGEADTTITPEAFRTLGAGQVSPDRPSRDILVSRLNDVLSEARSSKGPGVPALWRLADEDTTIHVFGTVHLLRPELEWRSDALDRAIAEADTIVFETDMKSPEAQRSIATDFLERGMFDDGRTLKDVLVDEDEQVISKALHSLDVSIEEMNTFEPWMASINLSIMKMIADGYDPNAGVESVIEAEAKAAGKSLTYLETISQQTDAFDLLPEEEQITMLYEIALLLDESTQMFDTLVDEWAEGDIEGIAAIAANPDGYGFSEAVYQSVLVRRNEAWVPQIEAMLKEPGTVFIAVGAGHLAGPDSLIAMLRDQGYSVEGPRIEGAG